MDTTYTFEIVSPKYGTFTVTAPERFRAEIEAHAWCVLRDPSKAIGCEFYVAAKRWSHAANSEQSTTVRLHRFIWALAGRPPVKAIDHIDGQPLNNSLENLRKDKDGGNAQNRRRQINNTSGVVGVSRNTKKWMAHITHQGVKRTLGRFTSITDAQHARDLAALKFHGDFAVLNKPNNDNCLVPITDDEYRAILQAVA